MKINWNFKAFKNIALLLVLLTGTTPGCLVGAIPPEFGNIGFIWELHLQNNLLEGPIPDTLMQLTTLHNSRSDFRWNHLHTDNAHLAEFLSQKPIDGDWGGSKLISGFDLQDC